MSQKEITSKIPKLRFREFQGEWKTETMRKLTTLITNGFVGKATDHYVEENGVLYIQGYNVNETGFDFYGIKFVSSEFHLKNKKSILREGDLLTIQTGDVGVTGYVTSEIAGSNCHALIISRYKDGIAYSKFYHQYFNSHTGRGLLKTIETGSTMKHLNCGDMEKLDLPYTSFEEQQKIASFLSIVDGKIEKLKTKKSLLEKYKKGVMQKIFSREIRFRDENREEFGEWEEKRLGDLLDYEQPTNYLVKSEEYSNSYKIPVLTAGKTFILGYTNEEYGILKDGLPVIIFDDFTTASKFVDFPFKAKSSAMKILHATEGNNIRFLFELLQQINFTIGGHGRHWISVFAEMFLEIPSLPEQQKIASFLSELDKKIDAINREIESAEKWKKGLLQQMFI